MYVLEIDCKLRLSIWISVTITSTLSHKNNVLTFVGIITGIHLHILNTTKH